MTAEVHPLEEKYISFSPNSRSAFERAKGVFPGGDTRSSAYYAPYPLSMTQAGGCTLTDADGHSLVDFMNNFTSLVHGHAHPDVVAAVQAQVARGSAYAASNDDQVALAELLVERVPSVEQLRFTSSGTEGTQMALRCARAATGRQKIMKMEGGYHGSYEAAEVSLVPLPNMRGDIASPVSLPVDGSFPESVLADVVVCPFNEPEHADALIRKHAHELAAIIVEPVLGSMGMVAADVEFLRHLRTLANEFDIVLIFDEVITFRVHAGGAQTLFDVQPDLTCFGKIIGGGLPVGGVGGKRDLMQLFSPEQEQPVMHASTFSGNALTMAAGLASMTAYDAAAVEHINALGEALRSGINQAFSKSGVKGCATGCGSLSNVHFADEGPHDARDSIAAIIQAGHISRLLHLGMLRRGVMSASRLMYCTSTAMTRDDVDFAVDAFGDCLQELRPYIEAERTELLH